MDVDVFIALLEDVWDSDSAYIEMLANEGARLREKSLKEESGDDVSEFSDDESDIAEELGYISPLDTVDPYVSFKQALTSKYQLRIYLSCLLTAS